MSAFSGTIGLNRGEAEPVIVMDLEWNRSYDKKKLDEILQIGAVRIDAVGGTIRDTFNRFIN